MGQRMTKRQKVLTLVGNLFTISFDWQYIRALVERKARIKIKTEG
jgi:hypothetical protein